MPRYGDQPRPRVLFQGFEADDPQYEAMARLVPTARLMPERGFAALRSTEWDIVVSKAASIDTRGHMHGLALGCERPGSVMVSSSMATQVVWGSQPSAVMDVPDDLPDPIRRLVIGELIPYLQALTARPYMLTGGSTNTFPFVLVADRQMIAGAFAHAKNRWIWALPCLPEHPELWFAAALKDWHERTPDLVPLTPGWISREAWMTGEEIAIRADLEALDIERTHLTDKLNSRELELKSAQSAATAAADSGLRRLLTGQGRPLVEVTIDALRRLKFGVEDVDEDLTPGTPKVEDLRLTDPDEPVWTNITEVRGYTAGAKLSDLQKIGRYAALFVQRTGEFPKSRWYLVNQFLGADPDTRRPPLAGAEDDIKIFAEDGGLVIDTRGLFQLVRAVEEGRIDQAAARRLLRSSTGVFQFDG
jgi:hypothetical protein